jgi:hypothetical protein
MSMLATHERGGVADWSRAHHVVLGVLRGVPAKGPACGFQGFRRPILITRGYEMEVIRTKPWRIKTPFSGTEDYKKMYVRGQPWRQSATTVG